MSSYNCHVYIENDTANTLYLSGTPIAKGGSYVTNPPAQINRSTIVHFEMTDGFHHGPEGQCSYQTQGPDGVTETFTISYCCARYGHNYADGSFNQPSTDLSLVMIPNPLPVGDHPVYVKFVVSQL
ncbi:MAG: hypothetical protein F9K23_06670 [Bacteroidetes bacterium]|nr:MAG: hypothetical protein F9K23_06670 [Bacteroidota bacterium]